MTRKAPGQLSLLEFAIHSGRRVVSTQYSFSAFQAAIDHVRSYVSQPDEIKFLGTDTVSWRGAIISTVIVYAVVDDALAKLPARRRKSTGGATVDRGKAVAWTRAARAYSRDGSLLLVGPGRGTSPVLRRRSGTPSRRRLWFDVSRGRRLAALLRRRAFVCSSRGPLHTAREARSTPASSLVLTITSAGSNV